MEITLGSTIIGTITMIICALPFVMVNNSKKKREKIFLQSLLEIAAQNNCQIYQHEILGNFAIGIDETKNFVFFYSQIKDKENKQYVDMSETQSCKVINTSRTFKNKDGNQKVIERLALSFVPTAKNKPEIIIEFFNADVSLRLNGELQLIEKWSNLINDRLKNRK